MGKGVPGRDKGPRIGKLRRVLTVATAAAVLAAGVTLERATSFDREVLRLPPCTLVTDRKGNLLRFAPDDQGARHLWVEGEAIPTVVREAFIAAEDRRFFSHLGFDLPAILRAVKQNLSRGRVVSGASTITQQLSRLAYPRERTYAAKAVEIARSARMEAALTKEEILVLYLNRVPLGNNLLGVEAAARTYFGKSARNLLPAEAAILAALPKAPGKLNPYGSGRERLLARKDWVLGQMAEAGFIGRREADEEKARRIAFLPRSFPWGAPHFVDSLPGPLPPGDVRTTLDGGLQRKVERILRSNASRLAWKGASQAAALVAANQGREVRAWVGSLEYSPVAEGYNDGVRALRSPGSTLKPLLYALSLDAGYTAATVLQDLDRRYRSPGGAYAPVNFNRRTYGPVSAREALANSLNLAAIHLLNDIGPGNLYLKLRDMGMINHPERDAGYYGLGLVVGNAEVSLEQLVEAFAALAEGGRLAPLTAFDGQPSDEGRQTFSPEAAFIVGDILSDPAARAITFGNSLAMDGPFRAAVKTGTSTNFRDGWAVGYTPDYTVGVWVGNFDGSPTWGLSGAEGAAPILSEILRELYPLGPPSWPEPPESVEKTGVCTFSGKVPTSWCPSVKEEYFIKGTSPSASCAYHRQDDGRHRLPAPFASWVIGRERRGTQGRYALADGGAVSNATTRRPVPRGARSQGERVVLGEDTPFPAAEEDEGVRILYPLDGDRFLAPPGHEGGGLLLRASCGELLPEVTWFVDGVEFARTEAPYEVEWPFARGGHTIVVAGPGGTGDSVRFTVE